MEGGGKKGKRWTSDLEGKTIEVWWPLDEQFYSGTVLKYNPRSKRHKILYDDKEKESLNLAEETWQFASGKKAANNGTITSSTTAEKEDDAQRKRSAAKGASTMASSGSPPEAGIAVDSTVDIPAEEAHVPQSPIKQAKVSKPQQKPLTYEVKKPAREQIQQDQEVKAGSVGDQASGKRESENEKNEHQDESIAVEQRTTTKTAKISHMEAEDEVATYDMFDDPNEDEIIDEPQGNTVATYLQDKLHEITGRNGLSNRSTASPASCEALTTAFTAESKKILTNLTSDIQTIRQQMFMIQQESTIHRAELLQLRADIRMASGKSGYYMPVQLGPSQPSTFQGQNQSEKPVQGFNTVPTTSIFYPRPVDQMDTPVDSSSADLDGTQRQKSEIGKPKKKGSNFAPEVNDGTSKKAKVKPPKWKESTGSNDKVISLDGPGAGHPEVEYVDDEVTDESDSEIEEESNSLEVLEKELTQHEPKKGLENSGDERSLVPPRHVRVISTKWSKTADELIGELPTTTSEMLDLARCLVAVSSSVWVVENASDRGDKDVTKWARHVGRECMEGVSKILSSYIRAPYTLLKFKEKVRQHSYQEFDWLISPDKDPKLEKARKNYVWWQPPLTDPEWSEERLLLRSIQFRFLRAITMQSKLGKHISSPIESGNGKTRVDVLLCAVELAEFAAKASLSDKDMQILMQHK